MGRFKIFILTLLALAMGVSCVNAQKMNRELTDFEKSIIIDKGTERPFSGEYNDFNAAGTYSCKQCGAELYRSADKFDSGCGWPSFDDEIAGAVHRTVDADGRRVEITCVNCGAHLGHVFQGEQITEKNTRHCVNSTSLVFVPLEPKTETAIFAGGCFWGVEYLMQKTEGVVSTQVGYTGGTTPKPSYEQVCTGKTGHAEALEVLFDPSVVSYETLAKLFFEIHDPTQLDRQGPDIGDQYRSEVFYTTDQQRTVAQQLIETLKHKGYKVVTKVTRATTFYPAETYHQDYYNNKGSLPYCHAYTKRF